MYKIETHLHTKVISKCGWMNPDEIAEKYHEGGYSAICVTDHYNRTGFEYAGIRLDGNDEKIGPFLEGCLKLEKAAKKYGIRVYKGAELRFDQDENDYLLYGFTPGLLAEPASVIKMGLQNFIRLSRADGALLVQAHPFRDSCTPAPAEYIDGMEVCNAGPRHEDHNELAKEYADRNGLAVQIGGSDCHRPGDECRGGILAQELPEDSFAFAKLLRSGRFTVIETP